ncbi:MAG: VOC family protein [Bacteroidetes bacterium]|nr:VOC family protein [Bacteroidota bacterium]
MNIQLNHIQHIGIPVTNLERSKNFYGRLGFKNIMQTGFTFNGGNGTVSMMKLNDMIIELYQMPEKELEEIKSRNNGHIDHIAFDVDDIDTTYKSLKEEGFNMMEDQPVFLSFWQNGCKYFNITGPDGERLEFNQIL